jgi:hypothetical protein
MSFQRSEGEVIYVRCSVCLYQEESCLRIILERGGRPHHTEIFEIRISMKSGFSVNPAVASLASSSHCL